MIVCSNGHAAACTRKMKLCGGQHGAIIDHVPPTNFVDFFAFALAVPLVCIFWLLRNTFPPEEAFLLCCFFHL